MNHDELILFLSPNFHFSLKPPMNHKTNPINSNMHHTCKTVTFLLFLCFFTRDSVSDSCFTSYCRRTEPKIRFPFRLHNLQPATCGYPGFDLFCDAFNQTLVHLPNSGNFTVQSIDYSSQTIWLNDPQNCIPKRLLELNLSGSPFKGYFFQDFTLFNCSSLDYTRYKLNPVGCLSGGNYSVFASSSERAIGFLQSRCSFVATVAVPVPWDFFEPVVSSDLGDDIRLKWGSPRCRRCESRGGRCGLRSSNSTEVVCTSVAHHGLSRRAQIAVIATVGFPVLLCLLGFICFLCGLVKSYCRRLAHPIMEFSVMVAPHPVSHVPGLDKLTIESYPKTILGESRRLPMPDQNICSICLSEYMPKDTLRSIPECRHCFHAECVDQWLRRNASCPVCRNSPASSPLEQLS